jgi:hypothetical protein
MKHHLNHLLNVLEAFEILPPNSPLERLSLEVFWKWLTMRAGWVNSFREIVSASHSSLKLLEAGAIRKVHIGFCYVCGAAVAQILKADGDIS